jgi:hypothetical protein
LFVIKSVTRQAEKIGVKKEKEHFCSFFEIVEKPILRVEITVVVISISKLKFPNNYSNFKLFQ